VGRLNLRWRSTPQARARIGLSLFFAFTAAGHVVKNREMALMLPPFVPYRPEIIYLTGLFELMGAIGVWIPRLMRLTGLCLIVMLIGILPSNIYSAFNRVEFGGHQAGPVYLLIRVPFQLIAIAWVYFATEQQWFRRNSRA
jgi:uncharacterized membrane protein